MDTITTEQLETIAQCLRPHLAPGPVTFETIAAAWADYQEALWDRIGRLNDDPQFRRAFVAALAGTYDEFRAEAGL